MIFSDQVWRNRAGLTILVSGNFCQLFDAPANPAGPSGCGVSKAHADGEGV